MARESLQDTLLMRRCLVLAARGMSRTSPNPMVGAVVARGARIISQAWHRRAGAAHAEAAALQRAGRAARGSTLYVNLEPCCHFGRTPPCVNAIIAAGVRRVVAAHRDPFPLVSGRGLAALRRAGVKVHCGTLHLEAARLNERYLTFVNRGRPFILVKAAMTLDGRIATAGGDARWVSSSLSRAEARRWRGMYDAVMIGINTALADDPWLTVRAAGRPPAVDGRRPTLRIVLDSRLRLGPKARLLRGLSAGRPDGVIVYTGPKAARTRVLNLRRAGAEVVQVRTDASGRVDLKAALADLARRNVTSLLIEGGGELLGSAFDAGVVDKVALFIAPVIVGGRGAVPVVGGRGVMKLRQGALLKELTFRRVGADLLVEGYVARGQR